MGDGQDEQRGRSLEKSNPGPAGQSEPPIKSVPESGRAPDSAPNKSERRALRQLALLARAREGREPSAREARRAVPSPPKVVTGSHDFPPLPPLPQRQRRFSFGTLVSFLCLVILPTALAGYYYFVVASNQYVSEFRFSVTDSSSGGGAGAGGVSGLAAVFGVSAGTNFTQNFMVTDFLSSRQAVDALQAKFDVMSKYSRPEIDWWSRFDGTQPVERFVKYWQGMLTARFDQVTGLAIAEVRAFDPQDAYLIATTLVSLSESLVNDLARRPQMAAVGYAEAEVRRAEDRLKATRAELTKYRNTESLIDPTTGAVTGGVLLSQTLRASLSQLQTDLAVLQKQNLNPNAPAMLTLQNRIKATREQLEVVEKQVSTNRDGYQRPLSTVVSEYEQLDLERQFAQSMLTSAMATLEQTRANAIAQRIFVTPYVQPALPQSSVYPRRSTAVLTVAAIALLIWIACLMIVRSVGEHFG